MLPPLLPLVLPLLLLLLLPPPTNPQQAGSGSTTEPACPRSQLINDHPDCEVLHTFSDCDDPLDESPHLSFVSGPVVGSTLLRELCPVSCGVCEPTPERRDFRNSCARSATGGCKSLGACAAAGPWTESRVVFDRICLANQHAAEARYSGVYYSATGSPPSRSGAFHCSCCGAPLYDGTDSFDSGSGWPAFSRPIDGEASVDAAGVPHVHSHTVAHNDVNGELTCSQCGLHLGHRFRDGPPPAAGGTFLRDCINSACMTWQDESGETSLDVTPRASSSATADSPTEPVPLCCAAGACPSDVTGDGEVGVDDLLTLLAAFGAVAPAGSSDDEWVLWHAALLAADINADGAVGVDDLLALLSDYGRSC
jgi:peptide-methionine (R)-S-oxide reductase